MLRIILHNLAAGLRVYFSKNVTTLLSEAARVLRARPLLGLMVDSSIRLYLPTKNHPHNSCLVQHGDGWLLAQRAVNYTVTTMFGRFLVDGDNRSINSETWMVELDGGMNQLSSELLQDRQYREINGPARNGFEDLRIFFWNQQLWCLGSAGEVRSTDWSDVRNTMALARIEANTMTDLRYLSSPHGQRREKNWTPWVVRNQLSGKEILLIIYRLDMMEIYEYRDDEMHLVHKLDHPDSRLRGYSGGSPVIPFRDGYLCIAHYATRVLRAGTARLMPFHYLHRFIYLGEDFTIISLSREFFLEHKGAEFCAGLASRDGKILLSYSVRDSESHIMLLSDYQVDSLFDH